MQTLISLIKEYDSVAFGLILGLVLSYFWSFIFPIFQIKYKTLINGIDGYISQNIKNYYVRQTVLHAILLAQKELASATGKERFIRAKTEVLKRCPDLLDEAVDKIIQTLYDEFVTANLIDNK